MGGIIKESRDMRYFCRKLETLARRVVQFYTQTLGFSISNTIFFVKNIESEKNGSFYEQKTECLGLKNRTEQPSIRLKLFLFFRLHCKKVNSISKWRK